MLGNTPFTPAFKFKQRIVLVIERGRKARAYKSPHYSRVPIDVGHRRKVESRVLGSLKFFA